MTLQARTIYRSFASYYDDNELFVLFKPSREELLFIEKMTLSSESRFVGLLLLKSHQYLGYFPELGYLPAELDEYFRDFYSCFNRSNLTISRNTLRRFHNLIREFLGVKAFDGHAKLLISHRLNISAQSMSDPSDLINSAIEELIFHHYSLPKFDYLHRLTMDVRKEVHRGIYTQVYSHLSTEELLRLEKILLNSESDNISEFSKMKKSLGVTTLSNMKDWKIKYENLNAILDTNNLLKGLSFTKIHQFATESHALELGDMLDMGKPKRFTLLICLIHFMKITTKDELVLMLIKRVRRTHNKAKERLMEYQQNHRDKEEALLATFSKVLKCVQESPEDEKDLGSKIKKLLYQNGGVEYLSTQTEILSRFHSDNYYPFLWNVHAPCRKVLMEIVDFMDLKSATSDTRLLICWERLKPHRSLHKPLIKGDFPLGFISKKWKSQIIVNSPHGTFYRRQFLELCLLTYISEGVQSIDFYLENSFQFSGYQNHLLDMESCKLGWEEYCKQTELSHNVEQALVELKNGLYRKSKDIDDSFRNSSTLKVGKDGKIHLRRNITEKPSKEVDELKTLIRQRMPDRNLLDIMQQVDHWVDFTCNFHPISGAEPKLSNSKTQYLLTVFGYGCNLGPVQMEKHTLNPISRRILSRINYQHIDAKKLQKSLVNITNRYSEFEITELWGNKEKAVADGTHIPLIENNLMGERHIRYGGYGGIAYHHISDTYIALFSHFISCGVWEAVYILDGLMKNTSKLQPHKIHADTQGQNEIAFGLSYLLGIELMPRIRNWKTLYLYKSDKENKFKHIDSLFHREINWDLIKEHWDDFMQIAMSIQSGKIMPSFILQKLGGNGKKNKLYKALRELGRVKRTTFLLQYISNLEFQQAITKSTNKIESFNNFCDWITFGGDTIMTGNPIEQEKRIKYTSLIANAVMLQNVQDMTNIINQLGIFYSVPNTDKSKPFLG